MLVKIPTCTLDTLDGVVSGVSSGAMKQGKYVLQSLRENQWLGKSVV
jgi:hypothetical protein